MMSKINQTDIDRLIELVGGRGNIATVSHCITRLRFVLNQPANARPKEIEQLPMVKGCFTNAGQFQVVIGTNVGDYYQALIASTGQAQVIPALLAGLALGVIETRLKRIVPDYLYLVVVPVCSLILAVFLAHALIGPFGRMIGDGVAFAVRHLMTGSFAPIGAALFGFLYAPLVITGVHQTTLAIDLQMIQSMGGTPVWPLIALSNIAQGSAVIGIIISSRKHNEREISVPAAISAWLGVTEPAMYGINLKYRFPMLCAMIGSGLAGLLCGLNGVMANGIGVGGLPGILSIQPSYWQVFALAMAIAIIIPIVLTSFIYQRKYRLGTLDIV
ncbi:PTS trehalose transporter subunit IIBC [Shigella sonnei]|nr:PTS trehalose transporter subunit IIBC [Escherichia coli]